MLEHLTQESFAPHLGTSFEMSLGGERLDELSLVEVTPLGVSGWSGARTAFSLVFRGSAGRAFVQHIYALDHAVLGRLELFLVPISPDADGQRYEAVFT